MGGSWQPIGNSVIHPTEGSPVNVLARAQQDISWPAPSLHLDAGGLTDSAMSEGDSFQPKASRGRGLLQGFNHRKHKTRGGGDSLTCAVCSRGPAGVLSSVPVTILCLLHPKRSGVTALSVSRVSTCPFTLPVGV